MAGCYVETLLSFVASINAIIVRRTCMYIFM